MWGWGPQISEAVQAASRSAKLSQKEMDARREALEKVEREGVGICKWCGDPIFKNTNVPGSGWTWESESMLGYCEKGGVKHLHEILIRYNEDEGGG